jgi:hypothetical protein
VLRDPEIPGSRERQSRIPGLEKWPGIAIPTLDRLEAKKAVKAKFTSQPTVRNKLCKQLDYYMLEPNEPEDSNSFNWWSANRARFPDIATVARSYLAIPATSVASERIFSKCGLTVSDRRSSLSPQHTEQIVFLLKTCQTIFDRSCTVLLQHRRPNCNLNHSWGIRYSESNDK